MKGKMRLRRTVIGFRDAYGSAASLEAVVRFSQALRTELLGVFIEDAELLSWMDATGGRSIMPGTALASPGRIRQTFTATERRTRKRLMQVAASLGIEAGFRVVQTSMASIDIGDGDPGDLVVVVEPAEPTARASYPFTAVLQAVAADTRPVLYVPSRVLGGSGPVIDLASEIDVVVSEFAADIAAAIERRLIRLNVGSHLRTAHALLAQTEESLIVVTRKGGAEEPTDFARLAAERMVPVLIAGTCA